MKKIKDTLGHILKEDSVSKQGRLINSHFPDLNFREKLEKMKKVKNVIDSFGRNKFKDSVPLKEKIVNGKVIKEEQK